MLAQFFIPQLKRAISRKFEIDPKSIELIQFKVNKIDNTIELICNDLKTAISLDEVSNAYTAVERAVKGKINGILDAYTLYINVKTKTFDVDIYFTNKANAKELVKIENIF